LRFVLKHAPLDTLLNDFLPAEREEIERWSIRNSLARKLAYLDALLALPDVLQQRSDAHEAAHHQTQLRDILQFLHHTVVEEERKQRAESGYRVSEEAAERAEKSHRATDRSASETTQPSRRDTSEPSSATQANLESQIQAIAPDKSLAQRPFEPEAAADEDVAIAELQPTPSQEPVAGITAGSSTDEQAEAPLPRPETRPPEPTRPAEPTEPEEIVPAVDVAAIMRQVRRHISERQGRQVDQELVQALDTTNEQWDKVYEPLHLAPGHSLPGRVWDVLRMRLHQEVRSYLDPMVYRQTELNASIVRVLNNLLRRSSFFARAAEIEALHDEIIQLREQVRQLQEKNK
jgi:hypothetical protein